MFIRLSLVLTLMILSLSANAQFGVRTSYNTNNAKAWNDFFSEVISSNEKVFATSLTYTLDYWLRLPNHRIEFYPYISYHSAKTTLVNNSVSSPDVNLGLRQIGAGIYTHVYLLDLVGDCDCPTFSKQGGLFKKGFFLMGGIGADYSEKELNNTGLADGNIDFSASFGAGFDIGITDLITITPFAQYQYYPAISWHELGPSLNRAVDNVETSLGQLQFGIRIGFRPDYK